MSLIKITPADSAFSKCVRQRALWICERCGKCHPENSQGLHCSHFSGRGNWSVRFDPDNAASLCYGCHMYMAANPTEHRQFFLKRLGSHLFDIVMERKNDVALAKEYRKTKGKGEVARHYRDELRRMQETGDRRFVAWL